MADEKEELETLREFVRRIANFTKEGEVDPNDPDGEEFEMSNDDNFETLSCLITEARELVAKNKPPEVAKPVDATVENHGSIYTLKLESDAAKTWADEHLPQDAQRIGTSGIVIEHRYIADIVAGMKGDGLVVE